MDGESTLRSGKESGRSDENTVLGPNGRYVLVRVP